MLTKVCDDILKNYFLFYDKTDRDTYINLVFLQAGENKFFGTDESTFTTILSTRNYLQLRTIFEKYAEVSLLRNNKFYVHLFRLNMFSRLIKMHINLDKDFFCYKH